MRTVFSKTKRQRKAVQGCVPGGDVSSKQFSGTDHAKPIRKTMRNRGSGSELGESIPAGYGKGMVDTQHTPIQCQAWHALK